MLQLLHHADESLREPHGIPSRADPLAARCGLRGIGQRRSRPRRPANRALGDPCGALHPKGDALVILITLGARA
jgi:hypothetical protein